jgi:hypothetical protein
MNLSFKSKRDFLKLIDLLPGGPAWRRRTFTVTGDLKGSDNKWLTETVEMFYLDAVEVAEDLIGNPAYNGRVSYAPHKVFERLDGERRRRVYEGANTADCWHELQVRLLKSLFGSIYS